MKSAVAFITIVAILLACTPAKDKKVEDDTNLPYPADEDLPLYQAEVDSGYLLFWTDIKMVSSAYMGNSKYRNYIVSNDNLVIRGEGLFIGMVEVETQDFIVELRFERPYKSKGRKSIWQVISAEEKPWPKRKYQSMESK